MLKLIKRCPEFVQGYKDYCRELYDNHVTYFVPSNPDRIDDGWFARTKDWYDKKELGQVPGLPVGFHYWAVDGEKFIGEFQLRTQFPPEVLDGIGSIGYAVRVSEQGKGYGTQILQRGLGLARQHGMDRVLLNISQSNAVSIHVCEKLGGVLQDVITAENRAEGVHQMCRYWIRL